MSLTIKYGGNLTAEKLEKENYYLIMLTGVENGTEVKFEAVMCYHGMTDSGQPIFSPMRYASQGSEQVAESLICLNDEFYDCFSSCEVNVLCEMVIGKTH